MKDTNGNPNITTITHADGQLCRNDCQPQVTNPILLLQATNPTQPQATVPAQTQVQSQSATALYQFLALYDPASSTYAFYECYLTKSIPPLQLTSTTAEIHKFVNYDCGKQGITPGGRRAYFRAIRAFFNWAYSPASGLGLKAFENPITWVKAPKSDEKIMPAQDVESFAVLLSHVDNTRDRAIISTLIDSGGRLSEVSNIHEVDILWDKHVIRAIAKGKREVHMPFSRATETLLKDWLAEYHPNGGSIWGINKSGIVSMLRRLEKSSGVKCNAHTFRRGFASILRRNGVDSLDIMKLGHWKSLRMVQKYTESVDFEDSQKRYKAPTERLAYATGGLPKTTGGLGKNSEVPRPRIELGTRGFSVREGTQLLPQLLDQLEALGQTATELKRALGSNGHRAEALSSLKKLLEQEAK